jgi:hypothetical protein
MKKIFFILLFATILWGENNAVDFMETGLSARAMAMGNAMTAGGRGIETVYHNPATLALNTCQYEWTSGLVNNFDLVDRRALGFAIGKYGFTLGNSEISRISRTSWGDDDRPIENGTFSSSQYQYACTYADQLNFEWLYGITLKCYTWQIDKYTANGLGLDIGGLYRFPKPIFNSTLICGMSIHNFGRTQINWSTGHKDTIPITLTSGATIYSALFDRTLVFSSELVQEEYEPLQIRNGAEYWLAEKIFCVRGGTDLGKFTIGIGLRYMDLSIDYAQADYSDLGLIKRVSCRIEF